MKSTYVPGTGNINAKLAIVGEQPGYQEIRHRPPTPFVGPAGQALNECLSIAKIQRNEIYITNVIKDLDKPLNEYINFNYARSSWFITDEGWTYINELKEELSNLKNLNCVLACGNVPLVALCSRLGISKWHGSVLESTLIPNLKVVPTFHPATFIPPKFNFLNKPQFINDLLKAKDESDFPKIVRKPRNLVISPTFEEAVEFLNFIHSEGLRGKVIDFDIEVVNGELDCISFAWSPENSICIPFTCSNGDYFNPDQEYEIMKLISQIISNDKISKRGANIIFDTQFLFHKYGIEPRGELHCTQIAQKILCPDLPAGLDEVCRQWTDIPYYKEDGKQWLKLGTGTWQEWWTYNAMDSITTSDAHHKQIRALIQQQNLEVYDRHRKLIKPLIYMSERGIKIDIEGMKKYKEEHEKELEDKISELHQLVGYDLNPNSPQQVMEYFYVKRGIKPYKKRNLKGEFVETSDVDALKRLARRGFKEAQILLDIRGISKRLSTYLDLSKIDSDGRMRSSYKPAGTETGRLASGTTIFGTGTNQQNWPHDLLRFFTFDDGYIGYSIDLSQIENRIVAYVGGVIEQIRAFEEGIDLHRMTASIIFKKPYDQISDKDGSCPVGDGKHSERFWGKKANHATNYDVGYKTFALKNEITETEAKQILERVHSGYPQIREGYHRIIQEMLFKDRYVTNLFGRRRLFLGPIFPSSSTPLSACLNTYREAYAHLAQSTCADKMNEQGLIYVYYNQDKFREVELLTQIHDSIVFQIPLSLPWTRHAEILLDIKKSLETPLKWRDREIPTPADISIGFNMCKDEMVEMKSKNTPTDISLLADKLYDAYLKLKSKLIK